MKLSYRVINFFRKDFLLKLASLLIAIVLWFFVVIKGQTEVTMNVPIELKYIPKGLGVESKSVSTVMISVKGFEQIIKNLKPYDIKVSLDLSKAKRGMNVLYITNRDVMLPSSLTLTAIEPSIVRIRLDEIKSKKIPVLPEITGEPSKGYIIESIKVEPDKVEIEGLRSQIDKLRYIKTEPVSIDNIKEDTTYTALLELPGSYIKISPEVVKVKVRLRRS